MLKSLLVRAQKNHHRGYLNGCKQTVNINPDLKDSSHEDAEGNEEHAIGNWRKVDSYYTVVILEGIAEMCPIVAWKAEFVND